MEQRRNDPKHCGELKCNRNGELFRNSNWYKRMYSNVCTTSNYGDSGSDGRSNYWNRKLPELLFRKYLEFSERHSKRNLEFEQYQHLNREPIIRSSEYLNNWNGYCFLLCGKCPWMFKSESGNSNCDNHGKYTTSCVYYIKWINNVLSRWKHHIDCAIRSWIQLLMEHRCYDTINRRIDIGIVFIDGHSDWRMFSNFSSNNSNGSSNSNSNNLSNRSD